MPASETSRPPRPLPAAPPPDPAPGGPAGSPPAFTRRIERPWLFVGVLLACVVVIVWTLRDELARARDLVHNEDGALALVERVVEAQEAFHAREGRFGWVEELEQAGLLEDQRVAREEGRRWVRAPGYRIDVLLPTGRHGGERIAIAARGDSRTRPDPALASRHFAVVARPLEPGATGWRSWYLDDMGELFISEGVVDDEGSVQNALPDALIRRSMSMLSAKPMLWQRATEIRRDD